MVILQRALDQLPLVLAAMAAASLAAAAPAGKPMGRPAPAPSVRATGGSITLQNATCLYEIGTDGTNRGFGPPGGKSCLEPGSQPFMTACVAGKVVPATRVDFDGKVATVTFGDSGVTARVRLQALPGYFALTVEDASGDNLQWLLFCTLKLTIGDNVGPLVNAAWSDAYGACVIACNPQTECYGASGDKGWLCARAWTEYGLKGARCAVLGVPTGGSDPDGKLLEGIGRVEVAEKLPHPLLNGVWIKQSPERFRSYLMVHDLSEANADAVIAAAKGGFGCIEFYPWRSTPSYELNPSSFPHGLPGLKEVCDKIHAAGMQVGLHIMQGMVGWGAKDDRYISPKPDPRLLQDPRGVLAEALDGKATTLKLQGAAEKWPERGDLCVDSEIISYGARSAAGFSDLKRGLYGTAAAAHAAGAPVGCLVNCFPIWGHTVYCPDVRTDLVDEICAHLAEVFNACGADMSYLDGGEELAKQPPAWRNQGLVALGLQQRLRKPIVIEGNACYNNHSWHVIVRGSPHFDPIYFGRREYTLRFKGTNPAGWRRNLLTGDVGWFAPHGRSTTTDAVTPDEVLLLCLKAVGGRSPISFSISAADLQRNPRMPEMLEIIRACDELKRREYFSGSARAALTTPRAEFDLRQRPDGEWNLRPLRYEASRALDAARDETACLSSSNPYAPQTPFVRLRARAELKPCGDPANKILADFADGKLPQAVATASKDLVQTVAPAPEQAPDGTAACAWTLDNRTGAVSQWAQLKCPLPAPVDLSGHRRLAVHVKGDGSGALLNIQLATTDARRDHYVPLDFSGWRLVELNTPEDARFWDHTWPYPWTDLFYTCYRVYAATQEVNLFLNAAPAGKKVECLIGRIEARQEVPLPVQSPALTCGASRVVFPVSLRPEEYVEWDFSGRCRHFDPNGKLVTTVLPQGKLLLQKGDNTVSFSCEAAGEVSRRAEVALAVRGEPLAGARNKGVRGKSARYEGLAD